MVLLLREQVRGRLVRGDRLVPVERDLELTGLLDQREAVLESEPLVVDVERLRVLIRVLVDPLLGLGPHHDVLGERGGLAFVLGGLDRRVEQALVVADAGRDRRAAVLAVLREVRREQRAAERGDVHLLAAEHVDVDVVDALDLDELDVVLAEPGLVERPQHERALRLAGGVGDLLALEVLEGRHVDAGGHAELVDRVVDRVHAAGGGHDGDVGAGPLREQRRDVLRGPHVDGVGAERVERLGATTDVGPLDLDALVLQLLVEAGRLDGGLGRGVTDAQHRAAGDLVGDGGVGGELRPVRAGCAVARGETGQAEGHDGGGHGGAAAATGPRPGAGCGANVHHSPQEIVVLFDLDTVD